MTKKIENRLNMYQASLDVCRNYPSVWSEIPVFANAVNDLESLLLVLRSKIQTQSNVTSGVSKTKNLKVADLHERILVLHKALFSYAKQAQDENLATRNRKSLSDLKKLSTVRLSTNCEQLREDLQVFGANLAPYGLSDAYISESLELISATLNVLNSPRIAIISRKTTTLEIADEMKTIEKLVKERLDTLIFQFKASNTNFYRSYRNARIIIDLHKKHKTPPQLEGESES